MAYFYDKNPLPTLKLKYLWNQIDNLSDVSSKFCFIPILE